MAASRNGDGVSDGRGTSTDVRPAAMKLLMVTHYFEEHRGGIEIVAGQLSRGLARRGAEVAWIGARDAGDCERTVDGVRRIPVSASTFTERALGFPYPLPAPSALRRIWHEVAAVDAVLLHDALYAPCVAAFLAARWHRKPVLIVQHVGMVPYRNAMLRVAMQLANRCVARPLLAGADQVAFISEITARHFSSVRFRRAPELIFNGVDTDVFCPVEANAKQDLRRYFKLPLDKPVALFVGRFVEKKGLAVLDRAVRLRPDVTWAFAGWGPEDPRRLGLTNVIVRDDLKGETLAGLYQASDVLVLPSVGEGFPLVIQEALACGQPVVCSTETAGADRAATHLLDGIELAEGDRDLSARRLVDAVDRVLSRTPGEGASARRALALERYAWPKAVERYGQLLERLIADRSARRGSRATLPV
jgi:glycosyltransferase involved in cell wall biosynthesis